MLLLGVWAFRVYRLGLIRRYPALFAYLAGACVVGWGGFAVHHLAASRLLGRSFYFWYWGIAQPLIGFLLFAVLFECFERMAGKYEGVRRLGRQLVYFLAGALAIVIVALLVTHPDAHENRFWTGVLLLEQQSVYFATGGSVLLLAGIRRFFRLPITRNVGVTLAALGIYVLSVASMTAIRSYMGHLAHGYDAAMDVAGLGMYCACLLFGALAFSESGESIATELRRSLPTRETLLAASNRLEHVSEEMLKAVSR